MPKFLAFIPCRSGSKRIPEKNLTVFNSKTLIQRTFDLSNQAKKVDNIVISTDSQLYLDSIIKTQKFIDLGLRSSSNSTDLTTDYEVLSEVISNLEINDIHFDYVIHLRPTYPALRYQDIDNAISYFLDKPKASSLKSVEKQDLFFQKCLIESSSDPDRLIGLDGDYQNKLSFLPSQQCNKLYAQTAAIDIYSVQDIKSGSLWGNYCLKYELGIYQADIDEYYDFPAAYGALDQVTALEKQRKGIPLEICFDIDGVLVSRTLDSDYEKALPNLGLINLLRLLYKRGHRIVLHTARGSKTGKDWKAITTEQLNRFDIPYHELLFGKPGSDFYIDDRFISPEKLSNLLIKMNTN